jgi:hypothetical protein
LKLGIVVVEKERPINVLWIEDEPQKLENFVGVLQVNRIIVKRTFTNSQEGMHELKNNPHDYDAVILDAKALKDATSVAGTETMRALRNSINAIKDISKDQNRVIPFCVYTGYFDDLDDAWEEDLAIFSKGRDQQKLIDYIKTQISELPSWEVIERNREVFELFDEELLNRKYQDHLIELLMNLETKDGKEIGKLMGVCRKLQEGVYKVLGNQGRLHPALFHENGRPNLTWCLRYLEGKKVDKIEEEIPDRFMPEHIGVSMRMIQAHSSVFGAHDSKDIASNYTLRSTVYAMMDVLSWLKVAL